MKFLFFQSPEFLSSGGIIVKFQVLIPSFQSVACKKLSQTFPLLAFYCVAAFFLFAELSSLC